jgi:predicted nuclease of predicted toxin-antitoxin system
VRALADLNVSVLVLVILRESGIDIERVTDVLDARAPDSAIVSAARERGAGLLTHDQDLGANLASSQATRPSLLNLRTTSVAPESLARCIVRALQEAAREIESGAIVTIEDGGIRVRRFPIHGVGLQVD